MFKKLIPIVMLVLVSACANTEASSMNMQCECCKKCECQECCCKGKMKGKQCNMKNAPKAKDDK